MATLRIAVVGAGAAGMFAAAEVGRRCPSARVTVFEAAPAPLAKVAITGGGRCNFTNTFEFVGNLHEAYPRGEHLVKRALSRFSQEDTRRWFAAHGVPSVVQDDACVFPRSQDAMDVVRALETAAKDAGVSICTRTKVNSIRPENGKFVVETRSGESLREDVFDVIAVTTGGSPKLPGLSFLAPLELDIIEPVPSLFTFNVADEGLRSLMGTVVEDASLSVPGTSFRSTGPLLLTHWGMSGPAALKLSSYAARHFAEAQYRSPVSVNWLGSRTEQQCRAALEALSRAAGHKLVSGWHLPELSSRLWAHVCRRAGLRDGLRWDELGRTGFNRLVSSLIADTYEIGGKSRWREEFVTCGGVALSNINISTLESKRWPGLFFAGEVLDVDAVTGGFNLQAAWSMAYVVAESIVLKNPN